MSGFLIATLIVAWLAALVYTGIKAMDSDSPYWAIAAAIVCILGIGFVVNQANAEEASGPCLKYETGYTLVGKVMTPYQYCAERGVWTK